MAEKIPPVIDSEYGFYLLSPLVGGADVVSDMERLGWPHEPTEDYIKSIIMSELIPMYSKLDRNSREMAKLYIRYVVSRSAYDSEIDLVLDRLLESFLLPFETPTPASLFFNWMWDIIAPGEEIELDPNEYVFKRILRTPNKTLRVDSARA